MPQLDGRVTMVISVLVALAPDAVAQQPFVGAGPDGTTLEISGAPVNVNGVVRTNTPRLPSFGRPPLIEGRRHPSSLQFGR